MTDEQIRVFVAIELPDDARLSLVRIQKELQSAIPVGVKWVRPEGIHLTLKFLGNVPSSFLPRLRTAVVAGSRNIQAFSLTVSGLGVFPDRNRPRVIWAGLAGDVPTLLNLQEGVDAAISTLGFARETRPYSAHLTLGKVQETATLVERHKIVAALDLAQVAPVDLLATGSVSVMQSNLTPEGAIYSRIVAIAL
ncbi:MAG: RNA 2',3'-cyclic phosphodiesterase [Dehalococcoidia bacterium]|nr:RNA 2',3'-cyclic phosphodiesterase [Dehalococcoidia bacterium]